MKNQVSITAGLIITVTGLLLFCVLGVGCNPDRGFNARLSAIVKPYKFSIARWEFDAIFHGSKPAISSREEKPIDKIDKVTEYFSYVEQIRSLKPEIEAVKAGNKPGDLPSLESKLTELQQQRASLENTVEGTIKQQIKETLTAQSIFNPADKYIGLKANFPPVNFKLAKPPNLLVVSPRDRIESIRKVPLLPNISLEQMEKIETEVDGSSVSSLVVGLGGFGGTYPTLVTNEASLRFTVDAAVEEWLHQYLFFKPLGFRYVLDITGIARNYEVAVMNETIASMVSKEIGALIAANYYSQPENNGSQSPETVSGFDFNYEMRAIRKAVDEYLGRGEIEKAEEFMEQKRQYLATQGYYIRKLNQAYFAFYGTYADSPTSISPIGLELKNLRSQSVSLKEFLETAAAMTSRQDLTMSLK